MKCRSDLPGAARAEEDPDAQHSGARQVSKLKLIYLHVTTGSFSNQALQKLQSGHRKIILLERGGMPIWAPRLAAIPSLWRTQVEKPGPTMPLAAPQASLHRSCLCSLSLKRCGRRAKHTYPLALHTAWQHNYPQDLPSPHCVICRSSAAATLLLCCVVQINDGLQCFSA